MAAEYPSEQQESATPSDDPTPTVSLNKKLDEILAAVLGASGSNQQLDAISSKLDTLLSTLQDAQNDILAVNEQLQALTTTIG